MRWLAALLAVLAAPASALAQEPPAAVPPIEPSADAFYRPPGGFAAAAPGTVLRSRTVPLTGVSEVSASGAAAAYQLLYRTTTVSGAPSATVTTLLLPANPAPGPRRLVSHQVPEDSFTTACAPSYTTRIVAGSYALGRTDFLQFVPEELARGWVVVVPDYEGPDSQLLVGPLAGRTTLDGIRAAINFTPAGLPGRDTQVGLTGYSGGSIPNVWAGSLAPTYAPEIRLAGITAGGVAADPEYILTRVDGTLLFGGVLAGVIGLDRGYPELDVASLFNARGKAEAASIGTDAKGCAGGITGYAFGKTSDYFNYPDAPALAAVPRVKAVLDKVNITKAPAPTAPVYMLNSTDDEIMLPGQVQAAADHYCAAGTPVRLDLVPGEHVSGESLYAPNAIGYLADRFAGKPAPSNCTMPVTPRPAATAPACASRRTVRYHLPRGTILRSVTVNGRRVQARVRRGAVTVSVAGRTGPVRIVLRGRTKSGRRYRRTSHIDLCRRTA